MVQSTGKKMTYYSQNAFFFPQKASFFHGIYFLVNQYFAARQAENSGIFTAFFA
jgi:hypothetical protein